MIEVISMLIILSILKALLLKALTSGLLEPQVRRHSLALLKSVIKKA
jgi:hypothetical protein